jgi:hypothetical protein
MYRHGTQPLAFLAGIRVLGIQVPIESHPRTTPLAGATTEWW